MSDHTGLRLVQAMLMVPVLFSAAAYAVQLEEIVVTAERRATGIQDVPVSVAAIAGDDLVIGKVAGLNDISFRTPGLTFSQFNVGEPRVYIRGIGNTSDSAASDQAVGIFLDEVYIGRTGGVGFDLIDLERIEILRGPQGTLYGKNTNGGAINIVTSRPSQDPRVKLSASAGNYSLAHVQALVNGGLSDSVSGKLVLSYRKRDGYGRNVITPGEVLASGELSSSPIIGPSVGAAGSGRDLDDAESLSARGQLLIDFSDTRSLLLSLDYSKDESNGTCRHLQNLDQAVPPILGTLWALGMSEAYLADDRHCSSQFRTDQERTIRGAMARFEMEMGWASFVSITAWRESDYRFVDDLTGVPLSDLAAPSPPGVPLPPGSFTVPENVIDGVDEEASQFSQEFRLTGSSSRLDWVAGLYYLKEDVERAEEFYTQYNALLQTLGLAAVGDVLFTQDNTTTTTAAYGQADWHFTDRWTLIYGLRWSRDKKEITQDAIDLLGGGPPTGVPLILPEFPAPVSGDDSWSKVTHRVSLNFAPTEDLLFYATYSEGFKSGAFPSQANRPSVAVTSVEPEFVKNREFGFKSTFWDNRVRLNASYYDMDYEDFQVFELNRQLLLVLTNADAESKGFDVEFSILPVENLLISASYNDSDARYTDFIDVNGVDVSGNRMVQAPDSSYTLAADFRLPIGAAGALDFNVTYNWKDDYFTSPSNAPKTMQKSLGILDASASWTSSDTSWVVTLWGKNLDDELQISNRIVDPTGITSEFYMPPRTYGVTLTKTF